MPRYVLPSGVVVDIPEAKAQRLGGLKPVGALHRRRSRPRHARKGVTAARNQVMADEDASGINRA